MRLAPPSHAGIDEELAANFLVKHQCALSQNGFLPTPAPLRGLPHPCYSSWESLAMGLPVLIETGKIRQAIEQCPSISTENLHGEPEWRRAYVILTYLAHGYIWGGNQPAEVLPPQISIPLLEVASYLDVPPVLTAAAANLWNFTSLTPSRPESTTPLITFTATPTESWFLVIGVAAESRGGAIIRQIFSAVQAATTGNYAGVINCLEQLAAHIEGMAATLARLPEQCDPLIFYHKVRPFYAGTKGMAGAGLPRGVFFDTGDSQGAWRQLRGGSNGQSSLFPLIDSVLGIRHGCHGERKEINDDDDYHTEILNYMPYEHRDLLKDFGRLWDINAIIGAADSSTATALRAAHHMATSALAKFRSKHIQVVSRYIILPSKQPCQGKAAQVGRNLATMHLDHHQVPLMGTSGTDLIPFLKKARDQTLKAASAPQPT